MDQGLDLAPVPAARRTASVLDVALLFAGANIVTTTLVTGGSLAPAFSLPTAALLVVGGVILGTGLIAVLARLGPRYGLPSMVLLRHPFGTFGAAAISLLLILTNFAWIAFNNVIAASALAHLAGGPERAWNLGVGLAAVGVALFGPAAMALFDRVAVPLLALVGVALTWALFAHPGAVFSRPGDGSLPLTSGFDLVVGYQVSWSLMFADYTRYQRRERSAAVAVAVGLTLTSLWLMVVGAGAGLVGKGNDPTVMILALDLPVAALLLMALSTITTNFVNLYMSSLAVKNLWPAAPPAATVLVIGVVGTGLGLLSPDLLARYGAFMEVLGTLLIPIVAVALVHFFVRRRPLADPTTAPRLRGAAVAAWAVGVASYQGLVGTGWGATLPTLAATALAYLLLRRLVAGRATVPATPSPG